MSVLEKIASIEAEVKSFAFRISLTVCGDYYNQIQMAHKPPLNHNHHCFSHFIIIVDGQDAEE